jgi:hypothetical protein
MKESFSLYRLGEREQKRVKAGVESFCICACAWANCGGSSTMDNSIANMDMGLVSKDYTPQNSC